MKNGLGRPVVFRKLPRTIFPIFKILLIVEVSYLRKKQVGDSAADPVKSLFSVSQAFYMACMKREANDFPTSGELQSEFVFL